MYSIENPLLIMLRLLELQLIYTLLRASFSLSSHVFAVLCVLAALPSCLIDYQFEKQQ